MKTSQRLFIVFKFIIVIFSTTHGFPVSSDAEFKKLKQIFNSSHHLLGWTEENWQTKNYEDVCSMNYIVYNSKAKDDGFSCAYTTLPTTKNYFVGSTQLTANMVKCECSKFENKSQPAFTFFITNVRHEECKNCYFHFILVGGNEITGKFHYWVVDYVEFDEKEPNNFESLTSGNKKSES